MRKIGWGVLAFLVSATALAESVTLPAAASLVGGAPFFSDVRAFNTSYSGSLAVTATYRCFIATVACPGSAPQVSFTLGPRESRAFDDMVAQDFAAPDTAGGVEFEFSGSSDQLVVTSRLFSTVPTPTVGMFIPGLDNSDAHTTTVLTSIRNLGSGAGFRTNVGVFNREDSGVTVTFTIFDGNGTLIGAPVVRTVGGHSGLQVTGIFTIAGAPSVATDNAVIVVDATGEIFSYAAVIDNATTDPIFVVGAEDQPPQPITPAATGTPTPPGPTPTPTPPAGQTFTVNVGPGGSMSFVDLVSGTSTTTIQVGDTVTWAWNAGLPHSTTSGTCAGVCSPGVGPSGQGWDSGEHSSPHTFTPNPNPFTVAGSYTYFCTVHGIDMQGTVVVNP